MSPLDAVDYGLSRQRELLPTNRIDQLVNFVSVTDGSAERSLTRQRVAVSARIAANMFTGLARAGKRFGESLSAPQQRLP